MMGLGIGQLELSFVATYLDFRWEWFYNFSTQYLRILLKNA
jgi:hypothetical protein